MDSLPKTVTQITVTDPNFPAGSGLDWVGSVS